MSFSRILPICWSIILEKTPMKDVWISSSLNCSPRLMDYLSFVNRFQCWGCSWHLPTSEIDLSGIHVWGQQSSVFCTSFFRLVLRIFSCLMIMQENLRKTEYITLYSRVSTSWRASWIRPWYLSSPHLQIQQSSEIKFIKLYVYLFLYNFNTPS